MIPHRHFKFHPTNPVEKLISPYHRKAQRLGTTIYLSIDRPRVDMSDSHSEVMCLSEARSVTQNGILLMVHFGASNAGLCCCVARIHLLCTCAMISLTLPSIKANFASGTVARSQTLWLTSRAKRSTMYYRGSHRFRPVPRAAKPSSQLTNGIIRERVSKELGRPSRHVDVHLRSGIGIMVATQTTTILRKDDREALSLRTRSDNL